MSDYLTEGWPLGSTSTVYMNGNSVYHVRRYGKPGIIATVELRQEQAEAIREVIEERIREARAAAWDEAYALGVADEQTSSMNIGLEGPGVKSPASRANPYRSAS